MQHEQGRAYASTAQFESTPAGHRFVLIHRPATGSDRGTVVLLPPFAEELNKSRRTIAETSRALAADGWRVVVPDLLGCGDSDGDFADASWDAWVADLDRVIDSHQAGGALWLWAVRAGALLLPPLLRERPSANVLLWQPSIDGSAVLNQFLRLRTSASVLDGETGADRKELRRQLEEGRPVEVAGYVLSAALANPLAQARLDLPTRFGGRVVWFDVAADAEDAVSPASQRLLDRWRAAGRSVQFEQVVAPQFWQTVEIAEAPELVGRTRSALMTCSAPQIAPGGGASLSSGGEAPLQPYRESAVWIECDGERMLGVVCEPASATPQPEAVLIVVGGPQYRVGSHRQFVSLARALAAAGFTSLRFDYRGMGDSEGAMRAFDRVAEDLHAALDCLSHASGAESIVVWGLCDAASAALMTCADDPRVRRLVLVNPWVRSEASLATTHLKHYYGRRLLERDFWAKLLAGRFAWRTSLHGLAASVRRAIGSGAPTPDAPFQSRMAAGWRACHGSILLVLSGRDLTAREFVEYASADPDWRGLLSDRKVSRVEHSRADHTFSASDWQQWLERQTVEWLLRAAGRPARSSSM